METFLRNYGCNSRIPSYCNHNLMGSYLINVLGTVTLIFCFVLLATKNTHGVFFTVLKYYMSYLFLVIFFQHLCLSKVLQIFYSKFYRNLAIKLFLMEDFSKNFVNTDHS